MVTRKPMPTNSPQLNKVSTEYFFFYYDCRCGWANIEMGRMYMPSLSLAISQTVRETEGAHELTFHTPFESLFLLDSCFAHSPIVRKKRREHRRKGGKLHNQQRQKGQRERVHSPMSSTTITTAIMDVSFCPNVCDALVPFIHGL